MPVSLRCSCGKKILIQENTQGNQVECSCGNLFSLPSPKAIPWKQYYQESWENILDRIKDLFSPLYLLRKELIGYWGFFIAAQGEETKLEHFQEITHQYHSFCNLHQELLECFSMQNIGKAKKLALEIYKYSFAIGQYCLKEKYSFKQFSEIALWETQIHNISHALSLKKGIDTLVHASNKKIPFFLRSNFLYSAGILVCIFIISFLFSFFFKALLFPILLLIVSLLVWLSSKIKIFYDEQHFAKVWISNVFLWRDNIFTPELVQQSLNKLFHDCKLDTWRYIPSVDIMVPEDLSSRVLPDIIFPADTPSEFGLEFDGEVREWCKVLYQFCRESFSEEGSINFCFVYSENLERIVIFLNKLINAFTEINAIKAQEVLFITRYAILSCSKLQGILESLSTLLLEDKYPGDNCWKIVCKFYRWSQIFIAMEEVKPCAEAKESQARTTPFPELFHGLRICLYSLSLKRPTLILLDHIENSDSLSLYFINSLTKGSRNNRICFILSYDREEILQNALAKETILLLQKQNCWKTPEKERIQEKLPNHLLNKQEAWEVMAYYLTQCITSSESQFLGIQGNTGDGKTFLGRKFLELSCQEDQFWMLSFSYQENVLDDPHILNPMKKLLENVLEEATNLDHNLGNRISDIIKFLNNDILKNVRRNTVRLLKIQKLRDSLQEKLDQLNLVSMSDFDALLERKLSLWKEFKEIISILASYKPVLLFIDDIHLADRPILNFFQYLAENTLEIPLFLIFTFQEKSLENKGGLEFHQFLDTMRKSKQYLEIHLKEASSEDLLGYICQCFHPNLLVQSDKSPFIQKIMEYTSGNILLITELLKLLLFRGQLISLGGFWILREELSFNNFSLDVLKENFLGCFSAAESKVFNSLLEYSALYKGPMILDILKKDKEEWDLSWDEIQRIAEIILSHSLILVRGEQENSIQILNPEYARRIERSISKERKKKIHRKIFDALRNSPEKSAYRMFYHAVKSSYMEGVLQYAEIIGKHSLEVFDIDTAREIFQQGISCALNLQNIAALAKYYLLKSCTFPSQKTRISLSYYQSLLEQRQWKEAFRLSTHIQDKESQCILFLKSLETTENLQPEEITILLEFFIKSLVFVEKEYSRIQFIHAIMPFLRNINPLKSKALMEQCLDLVEYIYNGEERGNLYLEFQKQIPESDFHLMFNISRSITHVTCDRQKALSIYHLSSFLNRNYDFASMILEETQLISDRVYHIMAKRVLAERILERDPKQAVEIFQGIITAIQEISYPSRQLEAMNAFLSGTYGNIVQKNFCEILLLLPGEYHFSLLNSLLMMLQESPESKERYECLNLLSGFLSRLVKEKQLSEDLEKLVAELKKLRNPADRCKGLLEIATGFLSKDIDLSHKYLRDALAQITGIEMNKMEGISGILMRIFPLLGKFPASMSSPIWPQIIAIAKTMPAEQKDKLFSEIIPELFSSSQEKAIDLLREIQSSAYRHKTIRNLLVMGEQTIGVDQIEDAILKNAISEYGGILLQELAEKDLGRARRLLKNLPASLETRIATAHLCKPPGQRIREILTLCKGNSKDAEKMSKIFHALETIFQHKEYDVEGNAQLLEIISDEYVEKIPLLLGVLLVTQEVEPNMACESFWRFNVLLEKHLSESKEKVSEEIYAKIEKLLQQLRPQFIEDYIEKLLPSVEIISSLSVRAILIRILCQKLKEVSPDMAVEIVEKLPPELRFKTLEEIVSEYEKTSSLLSPSMDIAHAEINNLESLVSLGVMEKQHPMLGQPVRQMVRENIIGIRNPLHKIEFWIKALEANSGWDEKFSEYILDKILEFSTKIPKEELSPYYKLLRAIQGLPSPLKNDFFIKVIDHLTRPKEDKNPLVSLSIKKGNLYNALHILITALPFGPSCIHAFVQKLLMIPQSPFDFYDWISGVEKFLFLSRGLVPEKESEWILQTIGYLDTFVIDDSLSQDVQEDLYLLRALSTIRLAKDLIHYDPKEAIRAAQRVIQLSEYSRQRYRLHRYILLQICSLVDFLEPAIQEKNSEIFLAIKAKRLQAAFYHLQVIKDFSAEQKRVFLQAEKNLLKEILEYIVHTLKGTLPDNPILESKESFQKSHEQMKYELENTFQKLLIAKPGTSLTQAFFVVAQALCLIDDDSLHNWPAPWLHRMIRIVSRIDPKNLSIAGDDILKADEREEFALFVHRVSLIFPRSVLLLINGMFSKTEITEISSTLEEDPVDENTMRNLIGPLTSPYLQQYRDQMLGNLALEWIEYKWEDGFLLIESIFDHRIRAKTIMRLLRKALDYYPEKEIEICCNAYSMLGKVKNSRAKVNALILVAIKIASIDPHKALEITFSFSSQEKKREAIERIVQKLEFPKALHFLDKISFPEFRQIALRTLLCKLPPESEHRIFCLKQIWDLIKNIVEEEIRIHIMKSMVRIGIRELDCKENPDKIFPLLLDMWENSSHSEKRLCMEFLCSTFPVMMKIMDENSTTRLFESLYHPENFPITVRQEEFKTMVL